MVARVTNKNATRWPTMPTSSPSSAAPSRRPARRAHDARRLLMSSRRRAALPYARGWRPSADRAPARAPGQLRSVVRAQRRGGTPLRRRLRARGAAAEEPPLPAETPPGASRGGGRRGIGAARPGAQPAPSPKPAAAVDFRTRAAVPTPFRHACATRRPPKTPRTHATLSNTRI